MTEVERVLQQHGFSHGNTQRDKLISEIISLSALVQQLSEAAQKDNVDRKPYSDDPWERVYGVVFSQKVSRRVFEIVDELGGSLDYCDPDTSYEDDVRAFADALKEYTDRFRPEPEAEPETERGEWPNASMCGCAQVWCSTCN